MAAPPGQKGILHILCIYVVKEDAAQEDNGGSTRTIGNPVYPVHLCFLLIPQISVQYSYPHNERKYP